MKRGQLIKLGVFVAMVAVVVVALVLFFAGAALFEDRVAHTLRIPDSVYGLERGAEVNLKGVRIGAVTDLQLTADGTAVDVVLGVDPEVRIPSDAEALLKFKGVTGLKLIDIVDGTPGAPPLEPGRRITYRPSAVDVLSKRADELAERAALLLEQSHRIAEQVSDLLSRFDPEAVSGVVEGADRLLATLDRSAARLDALLQEAREPLLQATADVGGASRRADRVLAGTEDVVENLDRLIVELRTVLDRNDDELRATTHNIRRASQYFEELARRLRERPSRLLFDRPPQERELP